MSFKDISISGGHFVQPSWAVSAILVGGIMRNISVKLFWIELRALDQKIKFAFHQYLLISLFEQQPKFNSLVLMWLLLLLW